MPNPTILAIPTLVAAPLFGHNAAARVGNVPITLHAENKQLDRPLGHAQACDVHGNPLQDAEGKPVETLAIVWHWEADNYRSCWNGYHGVVPYEPASRVAAVVRTLEWNQLGQHSWGRNTGHIGYSFCAEVGAGWTQDRRITAPGTCPIVTNMIEVGAILTAETCAWKRIDPRGYHLGPEYKREGAGTPDDRLVATGRTIVLPNLLDHKDLAERDQYAADRGDIGPFKAPLFARTLEFYDDLKHGRRKFMLLGVLQ